MPPIITRHTDRFVLWLGGQPCRVRTTHIVTIDLAHGDALEQVSIDEIVVEQDGQTIHPRTLSRQEFASVLQKVRDKHPL